VGLDGGERSDMKDRTRADERTPDLGKTPEGQTVAETPAVSMPDVRLLYRGGYGEWLGDPGRRYGRLRSSRDIPDWVKLEMLTDYVFSWCQAWVMSTLLKMKRVITCPDEQKRRFFETLWDDWGDEYLKQSSMAVALGHAGLIKRYEFAVPTPKRGPPVWTSETLPFIVTGFEQVYPVGSKPRFDETGKHFKGLTMADGTDVDLVYSLWITIAQEWVFGDYNGRGRLEAGYPAWWLQRFNRDMWTVSKIKFNDPLVLSRYPPGQTPDGTSHRDIARDVGNAARSGATVALSSEPYETLSITGEKAYTSVPRWDVKFLGDRVDVEDLVATEDHLDAEKALAYFLSPQMFKHVQQTALGGPTTAEVLAETAEDMLLSDARTLDRHINDYVFDPMETFNFSPNSPRVRIDTLGLDETSKDQLLEIIKTILSKPETDAGVVDLAEALRRLAIPTEVEVETGTQLSARALARLVDVIADGESLPAQAGDEVSFDVLRRMIDEVIEPVPEEGLISDSDIRRAFRSLRRNFPELFPEGES